MIAFESSEPGGWVWARRGRRVLVCLCYAVVGTAMGTAAGGWLGWQGAAPLVTLEQGMAVAVQAVPDLDAVDAMRTDGVWSYHISGANPPDALDLTGDSPDGGYVEVDFDGAMTADRLVQISTRLRGAGWTVHSDERHRSVSARKGDVLIRYYSGTPAMPPTWDTPDGAVVVEVDRAQPARVVPITISGGLVGLTLGAAGSVFLVSQVRRRSPRIRRRATAIGLVSLAALVPGTVLTLLRVIPAGLTSTDSVPPQPSWGYFVSFGVKPISILGVLGLATTAALTLARRATDPANPLAQHEAGHPSPAS